MDRDALGARLLLGRLLAHGTGAPFEPVDTERWSDDRWDALVWEARSGRVVPTLARALRDGHVVASESRCGQVDELWRAAMARCVHLESRLLWLCGELYRAGVQVRSLKGPASAHLDHRRPEDRQFGDVDVLVPGPDMRKVFDVLLRDGFARRFPEVGTGFDQRFAKSVSWVGDVEFDVHRTIAEGPIGYRIPIVDLWRDAAGFQIAGTEVPALDRTNRFLHACLHAELAPPPARLATIADLVCLLPSVDGAEAAARARSWGIAPLVDQALGSVLRVADVQRWIPVELLEETPASMMDAALMAAHRDAASSWAVRAAVSLITLPDWATRWSYVRALAVPTSSFVEDRHGGRVERLLFFARRIQSELRAGS